jgi:amino acid adenylation domain-containing protein
MNSIKHKVVTEYWLDKIRGCELQDYKDLKANATYCITIEKDELAYFSKLTGGKEIVEYTVLFTIFGILLQRYFEECQIVFSEIKNTDTTAVLLKLNTFDNQSFKSYLGVVKREVQETYKHATYNEAYLKRLLKIDSIKNFSSFGFAYSKTSEEKKYQLPFQLSILEKETFYQLIIDYNHDFVQTHVVEGFANIFKVWWMRLEEYISEEIAQIPILSEGEKEKLLFEFNHAITPQNNTSTILDLFENQAAKTPDAVAVVYQNKTFTYEEIDKQSNQLACYLQEEKFIKASDFVGVKLERTEKLIISILSVLKAGATYIPIDVNYPEERIAYIENDSNCKFVIDAEKFSQFTELQDNYAATKILRNTSENDLAYIIYTSGTTGNPKGVMISHSNAVALLVWAQQEFDPNTFEVVFAATSHCFDLSVFEMFYTLSVGKKIRVLKDALAIVEYLPTEKNILLNTVPSAMRTIIDGGYDLKNVKVINLAGEPFPLDIAHKLTKTDILVKNLYGPSEDTTYSTAYTLEDKPYKTIPIGKPIANTQAYILDENLKLLPVGVIGKLYLGGAGITKGYLNKPKLTKEKYIPNPFVSNTNMYDTGDLAHWCPDGTIEFFGRKDHQIKLRGYRIELGEIENEILQFSEEIVGAVTVLKTVKNAQVLVGYYASLTTIDVSKIRDYLAKKLPSYMIPTYFIPLKEIPLTPNGKVNRKALPDVSLTGISKKGFVAPRNTAEKELTNIWQEIIGVPQIAIKDNFFELGGHSLMIAQIINRISKEMNRNVSYKTFYAHPTIEGISEALQAEQFFEIPKIQTSTSYQVTSSQNRLWLLSQLEGGISAYKIAGAVKIKGTFTINNFTLAYQEVIKRHEVLRSYFKVNDLGELRQFYASYDNFESDILIKDVSKLADKKQEIDKIIAEELSFQYNLDSAPLLKSLLIEVGEDEVIFFISMHHIISDGWSLEVFTNEVIKNYLSLQNDKKIIQEKLPIQYKDYAAWLHKKYETTAFLNAQTYWLQQFKSDIPVLEISGFKKRPVIKTYHGKTITYTYPETLLLALKEFSKKHQVTLFMTLMTGVKTLLTRYSNQNDIIVGTPIAGRSHPSLENQIGLYLNTLAIRTCFDEDESFESLLQKEKQLLLDAYTYQEYPLERLIEQLNLKRDPARSPLFDVMIALQNHQQLSSIAADFSKLDEEFIPYEIENNTAQFDIAFTFKEQEELSLEIQYNTDIYGEEFIQNIGTHLENIFTHVLENSLLDLKEIDIVSAKEKETLLQTFNNTYFEIDTEKTVLELFQDQVSVQPENIAISFQEKKLSYKEVDILSNQLANYLLKALLVQDNTIVGVQLERSEWLIISILAILKTGAAYVPIDVTYPTNRIDFILQDANITCVIDEAFLKNYSREENLSGIAPKITTKGDDLAYIIYTSGSTGAPKGVMIRQKSLLNLALWYKKAYAVTENSRATLFSGIAFDASVFETFPYLISGATLYPIQSKEIRLDIFQLATFLEKHKITHSYVPARICQEFVEQEITGLQTTIITGGEALSYTKPTELQIYNNYGPTENTVVTTCFDCKNNSGDTIPIGKPIHNTNVCILSQKNALQPIGVVGELCISGISLAKGYLNRPKITASSFIDHPFKKGERLYKTGDLARWLPDGNIEFVGRKDFQVKIRGYRIELGEIEHEIVRYSQLIGQAVAMVKNLHDEKHIVAYYTTTETLDVSALRNYLETQLPLYMIPGYFIEIPTIPLTKNGKIAYNKLPNISENASIKKKYKAPENAVETELVTIWKVLLSKEMVGTNDDFFLLGGHSLLLTKLRNAYHKKFNVLLQFKELYASTTLKAHANLIIDAEEKVYEDIKKVDEQEFYEISPTQMRYWLIHKIQGKSKEFNIYDTYKLPENIDITIFKEAFNDLIKRHEVLRTTYVEINGVPKQKIQAYTKVDIPIFTSIEKAKAYTFSYEFNLDEVPLYRVSLAKDVNGYELLFNIHHSICDGWSMTIINRDLMLLYDAKKNNTLLQLPPLTIQYKDYTAWQKVQMLSAVFNNNKTYWQNQLAHPLTYMQLPTDYNASVKEASTKSAYWTLVIPQETKYKIEQLAKAEAVSVFSVFMAAFKIVMFRLTGAEDASVGIPAANRNHHQLKDVVGSFLNTLMHRNKITSEMEVASFLKSTNNTLLEGLEHQEYPFEQVLEDLQIVATKDQFPISPVFLNLLDFDTTSAEVITDTTPQQGTIESTPKFDLECYIKSFENGYSLKSVYNKDRYKSETIRYWTEAFINVLNQLTAQQHAAIKDITVFTDYITTSDVKMPSNEFTYFEKSEIDQSIAKRFETQVEKFPNRIAVTSKTAALTYAQLNNSANALANNIIQPNSNSKRIALLLSHQETCVIGMLGVLKSGHTYVPIDINNPISRIQYILEDANCEMLVYDANTRAKAIEIQQETESITLVEAATIKEQINIANLDLQPATEAYVLYTSGSTGLPKGVIQAQRNVLHYIRIYTNNVHIAVTDKLSVFSTYTFDASVKDIYGAILNGASVHIYSIVEEGLHNLSYWLNENKISIIHMVPTVYRHFIRGLASEEILETVRLIDLGGEACYKSDIALFKKHFPKEAFLVNDYGPTEATIISQNFISHTFEITTNNVPLGKVVDATEVFILDEENNKKGIYEIGEITFISDYLSLGYLNRKEQTEKVFIDNFNGTGKRIYKSGDIGRLLPSGEIEFLQRKDTQFKINGMRIELSEIEYQLEQLEAIDEAIVAIKQLEGVNYLTAYVRLTTTIESGKIQNDLGNRIPKYMIPSVYIQLEAFPLTRTGKIDRKSLPELAATHIKTQEYVKPENEIEAKLVEIWAEVLQVEENSIGVLDNFFDLGGNSLHAMVVINKINQTFNTAFTIQDLYTSLVIRDLGELLNFFVLQQEDNFEEDLDEIIL